MSMRDELGARMKTFYEQIPKTKLMRRMPVIIRLDGKAFHTFTRGFQKPFDEILIKSMQETMKYLCENIQGCVLGYTQSDEITLVLIDYKKLSSSAWFDYEVQKMCSVAASMATMTFNRYFIAECTVYIYKHFNPNIKDDYIEALDKAVAKGAMFDARVFNIPKEEVANCLYWRQLDAARNSVQMVGQAYFSHKELDHKSQADIQEMLYMHKGINWSDLPTHQKRGSCCIKETYCPDPKPGFEGCPVDASTVRTRWIIDKEIPMFKCEGRAYVDKLIFIGE